MVRGGRLRHPVDILRPVLDQGPGGTPDAEGDFTRVDETWGEIIEDGGSRENEARTEVSITEATITLRHRDDIQPGWRIAHTETGVTYEVQSVANDETRADHIVCESERMYGRD